jgi:transposase
MLGLILFLERHNLFDLRTAIRYYGVNRKEGYAMFDKDHIPLALKGPGGTLELHPEDEACLKLVMLFEGACTTIGPLAAAAKYGYTKQRFYQLREKLRTQGLAGLKDAKRGPKGKYRRTSAVEREVIRQRFLDPEASPEVITQKLRQTGHAVSIRSVQRVIQEYGLQKKTFIAAAPGRKSPKR